MLYKVFEMQKVRCLKCGIEFYVYFAENKVEYCNDCIKNRRGGEI